jgi:hypothetical protein
MKALLLASLLALEPALLAADPPGIPPPPVVSYRLSEIVKARTPGGEMGSFLSALVTVQGQQARLESERPLPRSSVRVVLAGAKGLTFLDLTEKLAATATREDFQALFQGRVGADAGSASNAYREVSASIERDGAGKPVDGRATARYRVHVTYILRTLTPGRVQSVKSEINGTIETLDLDEARSPFDDLSRLFLVRGDVREAVDRELAKVKGLPVAVSLEAVSEMSAEVMAVPGGGSPDTEPPQPPLKSTRTVTRKLSALSIRDGKAVSPALFAAPDDFHDRGLDRLLTGQAPMLR